SLCVHPAAFMLPSLSPVPALALHDALPILPRRGEAMRCRTRGGVGSWVMVSMGSEVEFDGLVVRPGHADAGQAGLALRGGEEARSEEHTSELQSREKLVCRLLLEKKKHLTQ